MEARAICGPAWGSMTPAWPEPMDDWQARALWPVCDLVCCGIGKTNAAGATATALGVHDYRAVISVGIAGSLPGSGLALGDAVAGTASVYADEGLESPTGFLDCHAMGFPLGPFSGSSIPADPGLMKVLRPVAGRAGPIATVSTCSGTHSRANAVQARTGALAEAMEGAAVAHVASRLGAARSQGPIAVGEVRVISNTTGDRGSQKWELKRALERLGEVLGRLRDGLGEWRPDPRAGDHRSSGPD
jgi:futalosine hydrolase